MSFRAQRGISRFKQEELLILFNLDLQIDNSERGLAMVIKLYYVYILTNAYNKVLYTGVTNDLERRCYEHKQKLIKGFSQKYNVDKLVYFEKYDFIDLAIAREKQIKGYSRAKKIALINKFNKDWKELCYNKKLEIPN
jgi:putative endonuclease